MIFAVICTALQTVALYADKAMHLDFSKDGVYMKQHSWLVYVLYVVRIVAAFHVFFAYATFWSLATWVMLMAGHSMSEYAGNALYSFFHKIGMY